jgi:hypothetical protein
MILVYPFLMIIFIHKNTDFTVLAKRETNARKDDIFWL